MKRPRHFCVDVLRGIDKKSEAGLGFYAVLYGEGDIVYGAWSVGVFCGRYLLSCSQKRGVSFCDYFATGLGG